MDIQQQITQQQLSRQRVKHIIDSYALAGDEADAFDAYLSELLDQYPHGLIELALVETLVKNWLTIPMKKGVPFLAAAHDWIKQWQLEPLPALLTPAQFEQITGLDPQLAFAALHHPATMPTQATTE